MSQHPFRDEREAALARVHQLERELARKGRELSAAKRELARRRSTTWQRSAVGVMLGVATLFVVIAALAVIFTGCLGASTRAHTGLRYATS